MSRALFSARSVGRKPHGGWYEGMPEESPASLDELAPVGTAAEAGEIVTVASRAKPAEFHP